MRMHACMHVHVCMRRALKESPNLVQSVPVVLDKMEESWSRNMTIVNKPKMKENMKVICRHNNK